MVMDSRTLSVLLLSFRPIKSINTLCFFNASLSPVALKVLEESLPTTAICHLQLDYNPLDGRDESTASFLRSITAPTSKLISLSLRGNNLGQHGANILSEGLALNTCLQSLNLFDNGLEDVEAIAVLSALSLNASTQIGHLSLANNRLAGGIAKAIADMITSGVGLGRSIQDLNLSSNCIDETGLRSLLEAALPAAATGDRSLRAISLQRNASPPSNELVELVKTLEPRITITL